ncbi:MAG: hypothetical protein QOE99_3402 [Actinomycetota bacterium]|jgi:hypothetical protein|nr:hypothetical protein [Actinomycetota bacterium]
MDEREQRLGRETAAVWTTSAAHMAGLSDDQIRGRRASGEWQQLRLGTYADGGVVPDAFMRGSAAVQAACTVRRVAVAAGRTAARMWGIPLVDDHDPATQRFEETEDDVALTFGETTAATLHSRQLVLGRDDVCLLRGVPVLSLRRTLVDLAVVLRPDALVCALDFVLHHDWVSRRELDELAAARAWCPGVGALRHAIALTDPLAESPHETLTRLLLKPVLPGLRSQVQVFDRAMRPIARLDLGDEVLRLGVESDGSAFHRGRAAEDRRRDYRTGWTIERCSWFETRCEGDALRRRVLSTATGLAHRAS